MKQIIAIGCIALVMAGCNDSKSTNEVTVDSTKTSASSSDVVLPYTLEKPYRNWEMGSTENVAAAMAALKGFEDNDFAALAANFGDSIDIALDNYHEKLSRDSAIAMFKVARAAMTDFDVTMYDYESVISADKKDEWVTLWYKQVWKDKNGKMDSLNVIDDCKMQNGKIIELDEKIQHSAAKK